MKNQTLQLFLLFLCCTMLSCGNQNDSSAKTANASMQANQKQADYAMVIHGGAGTILKKNMSAEKEKGITTALNEALTIGEIILKNGGSSLDAITKTIMFLENSPYFNAGKGAVFTNKGTNELDASIMEGKTQNAGAVGGVSIVKNPITAARAVLEKSDHVFLSGAGADLFAKEQGLEIVDNKYFYTEGRWKSLQKAIERDKNSQGLIEKKSSSYFGTVGAAALDKNGNLAAGTSTGGMTNKKYNRIGDSPIIGAGTYANNNTCAISSTGHGEYFIRYAVAYDISARMEYGGTAFQEAADHVINKKLKGNGGTGGIIGVDKYGNVAMPFNTAGMYRGFVKDGERAVMIYGDE